MIISVWQKKALLIWTLLGRADDPYYAKAEILADYLQKNLPDFHVFKITQHPDVWEVRSLYNLLNSHMHKNVSNLINIS